MIICEPHSGLANRIRTIASALALAKELDQKMIIIWRKDIGCNINYLDLFEGIPNVRIKKYFLISYILKLFRNKRILKRVASLFKIDFYLFDPDFPKYVWNQPGKVLDLALVKYSRNIYVNACQDFYDYSNSINQIIPNERIKSEIEKYKQLFSKTTIGIHIRRTDNLNSILYSPVELFVNKMKDDIFIDSTIKYFVATDDISVENMLLNLFPNHIVKIDKIQNRNTKEGMIGAAIDLFCLSKCNKIYGSFWSSFSEVASIVGNIPLEILKNNNESSSM